MTHRCVYVADTAIYMHKQVLAMQQEIKYVDLHADVRILESIMLNTLTEYEAHCNDDVFTNM